MRKSVISTAVLAAALVLAGCSKQVPAAVDGAPAESGTHQGAAPSLKHGTGIGTVTALDPSSGSVTLDHGAIAELGWPAMKMTFAAKPAQLAKLRIGDKVEFGIDWDGTGGSVTNIGKPQ